MLKTDIVNMGYGKLGVSYAVFDFDNENSKQAMLARKYFQIALDTVTEANDWSFATKSGPLALLGTDVGGMKFHYQLPTDCLVVRQIAEENHFIRKFKLEPQFYPQFEIYGDSSKIITNTEKAHALYTRRVMQDEEMPNYFARAVAAQFALDVGASIIMDKFTTVKARIEADLERDIGRAISYDTGRDNRTEIPVSSYELLLR